MELQPNYQETEVLSTDLQFAINTAHKAGSAIVKSKNNVVVQKEGVTNYQTAGDFHSNEVVMSEIQTEYPGDLILSEESDFPEGNLSGISRLWVVDPLDGSANFKDGIPEVWVAIGLFEKGEQRIAVAYNPFTKTTFYAEKGKGAYSVDAEGKKTKLQVSQKADLQGATVETGISYDPKESDNHELTLLYLSYKGLPLRDRRIGSSVGQFCRVAAGMSDLHFHTGLKPWDLTATLIVTEAGGISKRTDGSEFNPLHHKDNISGNLILVNTFVSVRNEIRGNQNFANWLIAGVNNFKN